ncbi:hypothetical protein ACFVW8_21235 [Streptomyces sp. NPDC058221]
MTSRRASWPSWRLKQSRAVTQVAGDGHTRRHGAPSTKLVG